MVPTENPEAEAADRAGEALRDVYVRSQRVIDRRMTDGGASFARARVLFHIAASGPTRSTDLAATFRYAPRTVTEAIDGLERDGLVRREPDPDDRRAKRIVLTPAGITAAKGAEKARREFTEQVFGGLDLAERLEFSRLLGKISESLVKLGG